MKFFGAAALAFLALTGSAMGAGISIGGAAKIPGSLIAPNIFVKDIYDFALLIGGMLAFGAIVYGAARYTLAAGNPSAQHEGKDSITQALLGLLLLFGAYLVLHTINPALTTLSLPTLKKLEVPAVTGIVQCGGAQLGTCPAGQNCIRTDPSVANYSCAPSGRTIRGYGCPNAGAPGVVCSPANSSDCYDLIQQGRCGGGCAPQPQCMRTPPPAGSPQQCGGGVSCTPPEHCVGNGDGSTFSCFAP